MSTKQEQNEKNKAEFSSIGRDNLKAVVNNPNFGEEDAELIYNKLMNEMRLIPFGDFLKRYIYKKLGLEKPFEEVGETEYRDYLSKCFTESGTPYSFKETSAKPTALMKNWLNQCAVNRKTVLLLGFGLNLTVDEVNEFLNKALQESALNPKDDMEVICWYCYKNSLKYSKYKELMEKSEKLSPSDYFAKFANNNESRNFRDDFEMIQDEETLLAYVAGLKNYKDDKTFYGVTAREHFNKLYNKARECVAKQSNEDPDTKEELNRKLAEYRYKLENSPRKLYKYEIKNKVSERRKSITHIWTSEDISPIDIENIICSAVPKDKHGNLTPAKASTLNKFFVGKRLSRQRLNNLLNEDDVERFDLITLNFFVFSYKLDDYRSAVDRYNAFVKSTDDILMDCAMSPLYAANPYECFLMMCMLSIAPLSVYADVIERSYED